VADIEGQIDSSWLDSYLYLIDSDGKTVLAEADDEWTTLDSKLGYTLPQDGTYYLEVIDYFTLLWQRRLFLQSPVIHR